MALASFRINTEKNPRHKRRAVATTDADSILRRAVDGESLSRGEALFLYTSPGVALAMLAEAARELRRRGKGRAVTYSPKVFLPLTNLCRDRCRYCTFRRDPDDAGAHWMEPEEVLSVARAGEALGCNTPSIYRTPAFAGRDNGGIY